MLENFNKRTGRKVLGVFVDALSWQIVLTNLITWGSSRQSRYVCQCNVDVIVKTTQNEYYRNILNSADLVNPDGMPIVWALRKKGFKNQERISGPDLMLRMCQLSEEEHIPVFFYGSKPETLEKIKNNIRLQFNNLEIAGTYSPPFHNLSIENNNEIINLISSSGAGIVFVGLGCPKQEIWMFQNRNKINAVMIGVGAAFDFYAGTVKRAPIWIQKIGMEWFFRLIIEPKRLWKRYFIGNKRFILKIYRDIFKYKLSHTSKD